MATSWSQPRSPGASVVPTVTMRGRAAGSMPTDSSASFRPPTASRTVEIVPLSAMTIRAPESAMVRISSPVALRGFTGTTTMPARNAPRYDATNSMLLPAATITR